MKQNKLKKLLIKSLFLDIKIADEKNKLGLYELDKESFDRDIIKIQRKIDKVNEL